MFYGTSRNKKGRAFSDYDRRNADFYLSYYDNDKSYAYKNEGHDYSEIYRAVY